MTACNPLTVGIELVRQHIGVLKDAARDFYYRVALLSHECFACGGRLTMTGPSRARCQECGCDLDPTAAFQRSLCCNASSELRRMHYACTACGAAVPSMFLFDETVLDREYFKEAMRECRERARERRDRVRQMLLGTRSGRLSVTELPELDEVPGLAEALAELVQGMQSVNLADFAGADVFDMPTYRRAILETLCGCSVLFDAIPRLGQDPRRDRVRRFVTLVFMEQEREVSLTQYGNEILIEKYEAET